MRACADGLDGRSRATLSLASENEPKSRAESGWVPDSSIVAGRSCPMSSVASEDGVGGPGCEASPTRTARKPYRATDRRVRGRVAKVWERAKARRACRLTGSEKGAGAGNLGDVGDRVGGVWVGGPAKSSDESQRTARSTLALATRKERWREKRRRRANRTKRERERTAGRRRLRERRARRRRAGRRRRPAHRTQGRRGLRCLERTRTRARWLARLRRRRARNRRTLYKALNQSSKLSHKT